MWAEGVNGTINTKHGRKQNQKSFEWLGLSIDDLDKSKMKYLENIFQIIFEHIWFLLNHFYFMVNN